MTAKKQKRIAVINDFSGFGRCSLTVSIPIISAMKIQCCALPTAIFSNHTGYDDYFFDDYTEKMRLYYSKWKKLNLKFDGIYTGFLGSVKQVEIVQDFIKEFANPDTKIISDTVMGDDGKVYATYNDELCNCIKNLIPLADIITPNLTEACILTDTHYNSNLANEETLIEISEKLYLMGCKKIVITGIKTGEYIGNFIYCGQNYHKLIKNKIAGQQRAGTGDVFSSIIAADAINNVNFETSVKKAADFVGRAIVLSDKMNIPTQDGVCFEEILYSLM